MDYRDESEAGEAFLPDEVVKIRHEAEESYRGPRWIRFAVLCTLLFSAGSIALGVVKPKPLVTDKPPEQHITSPSSPTIETGNLPITLSAHFGMTATDQLPTHLSVCNHALYLSTLNQPVNEWPTIAVSDIQYSDSGETLQKAIHAVGKVELVPPISSGSQGKTNSVTWTVRTWHAWAMGDWVIAAVDWMASEPNVTDQIQLYSLYIPTQKYGMFQSLSWNAKSNPYEITAGNGNVVIVSPRTTTTESGKSKGASVSGQSHSNTVSAKAPKSKRNSPRYRVSVEAIGGNDPLDPITKTTTLSPSGPIEHLIVHNQYLFYSTLSPTGSNESNQQWFLQTLQGRPTSIGVFRVDAGTKPVVGTSGKLYFVEAVPGSEPGAGQVVRMSSAASIIAQTNESIALPSLVKFWQVSDGTLIWTQQVNHQWTVVIGTVN